MKVLAIIPAKLDSTRLKNKNIRKINGKPMVEYSIDYAKQSKYNPDIIISSENNILEEIANKNITIDSDNRRSGAMRLFKYDHLINGHVSKRIGCVSENATDIHYRKDLIKVSKKLKNKTSKYGFPAKRDKVAESLMIIMGLILCYLCIKVYSHLDLV